MARYAEWNSFIRNLATDKYGQTDVNEVGIAFEKATADVVPKSEVEKIADVAQKNIDSANKRAEIMRVESEKLRVLYENARHEVAREIFDDIKCSILAMSTLALFSYTDNLEESNAKQKCYKYVSELIDELDKRYT